MKRAATLHRDIVVIGTSAGGVEALQKLVAQFPKDFPASILVVMHLASGQRSMLPKILSRAGRLPAIHAEDRQRLEPGCIYVAPADHHLLVEQGRVRVTAGPRENGHRPAVDPLFRSAAQVYGPRVVAVVLTGALDCGTAGLLTVKARGGVSVVQEPKDALCPDMPRSALEFTQVDHCVTLAEMGPLLVRLVSTPLPMVEVPPPSAQLQHEVEIMKHSAGVKEDPHDVGTPSLYSCPDCGGVLFEMDEQGFLRYRCRVGHGYTGSALTMNQQNALDGALWAALRALEESASLSRRMAGRARERNQALTALRYEARAQASEEQAQILRQLVLRGPLSDVPLEAGDDEEPSAK